MNRVEEIYECCKCIYWKKGKPEEDSDGHCCKYDIDTYADDNCSNIELREENYPSSNYFSILD